MVRNPCNVAPGSFPEAHWTGAVNALGPDLLPLVLGVWTSKGIIFVLAAAVLRHLGALTISVWLKVGQMVEIWH